jgi:hypothetical protein
MKRGVALFKGLIVILVLSSCTSAFSQESSGSKFSVGSDFYSSYIWRGSKYGTGSAVQPSFKFTAGGFSLTASYINKEQGISFCCQLFITGI